MSGSHRTIFRERQFTFKNSWSKKLKEKLNLPCINANKYSFLSKREVEIAVFAELFSFCVIVDRDKVEVHKKKAKETNIQPSWPNMLGR